MVCVTPLIHIQSDKWPYLSNSNLKGNEIVKKSIEGKIAMNTKEKKRKGLIRLDSHTPFSMRKACELLSEWTKLPIEEEGEADDVIQIIWPNKGKKIKKKLVDLDEEGYLIKTEKKDGSSNLAIRANTVEGATNGIYGLWRRLKISQSHNPFIQEWDIKDIPAFKTRGIWAMLMPWGFEELSFDAWTLEEWKKYLERIRSLGANSVIIFLISLYHPDFPELEKNAWRYRVIREAIIYGKRLGLKMYLIWSCGSLPPSLWWKYPSLRAREWAAYHGIGFCWQHREEHNILKIHRYIVDYFEKADGFCFFAFEGGVCLCKECAHNLDQAIVEAMENLRNWVKEAEAGEKLMFCGWFAGLWEGLTPNLREKLSTRLPKDITIVDVNRSILYRAQEKGHKVIDFVFLTDPEAGRENRAIFPRPRLKATAKRILGAKMDGGLKKLEGLFIYRLTPPTRFLSDYAALRLAWNPELRVAEIVDEVSGFLTSDKENKKSLSKAILSLEKWWQKLDEEALGESVDFLTKVKEKEKSEILENIWGPLSLLPFIYELSKEGISEKRKEELQKEIYQRMRKIRILRCYTTDQIWVSRAQAILKTRLDWWTSKEEALFGERDIFGIEKGEFPLFEGWQNLS